MPRRSRRSGGESPAEDQRKTLRPDRANPPAAVRVPRTAAAEKGALDRKIVGDADILLFPDIHAGNLVYKAIEHMITVKNGKNLTATQSPDKMTSRSDTR